MNEKGFVIYNKICKMYCNAWTETTDNMMEIELFDSFEDARDQIEGIDSPEDFEIHEVEFNMDIKFKYSREVKWNMYSGKVSE